MRDKEEKWPTVRLPDLFIQQSPHGSQHCLCLSVNQTGGTWQQSGRLSVSKVRAPHNRLDKLRSWHLEMDKYMLPITTEWIFSVGKNNTVVYALQTGVAKNILTSQTQRCSFKSGKTTSRLKKSHCTDPPKIMMRLQETCMHMKKKTFYCHQMILYNQNSFRGACGNVIYSRYAERHCPVKTLNNITKLHW